MTRYMREECNVTNLKLLNLSETMRLCILLCLIFELPNLASLFQLHILTLILLALHLFTVAYRMNPLQSAWKALRAL